MNNDSCEEYKIQQVNAHVKWGVHVFVVTQFNYYYYYYYVPVYGARLNINILAIHCLTFSVYLLSYRIKLKYIKQ